MRAQKKGTGFTSGIPHMLEKVTWTFAKQKRLVTLGAAKAGERPTRVSTPFVAEPPHVFLCAK